MKLVPRVEWESTYICL